MKSFMPGWTLDEFGRLKRETIPRMGRRLRGWDYSKRMIYEITIVLEDRRPILGRVVKESEDQWAFKPSAIGLAVLECWREIPTRWSQVELIESQLMPDHFHGILFIREPLPKGKTLSNIVGSFKSRSASEALKILVARDEARNVASGNARASVRARFWAEGYVDVILFRRGQLDRMIAYLRDNPRRLGVKRERPDLFKVTRKLNIQAVGWFSAIGNHFLLTRHSFHQIQCSRRFFAYARDGRGNLIKDAPPALVTSEFEDRLSSAFDAAQKGAVLISPCISQGEREIARRAFEAGYSVITLANKGFSPLYKPGGKLFEACANGNLLMLAPIGWPYQVAEKPITRIDALILNRIAQLIAGDGAAKIDYKGVSMTGIDEGVIKVTNENE
ncbi:MAG: transposase [Kiritimatiellae bacterium]|nr:transposase [Kiritimatiellia bacterium]